jgi:elongation factor Ts
MANIDAIKNLRQQTGLSIIECKKALDEAGGDINKALKILENRSRFIAAKKSERVSKAGIIESYVHSNGKIGVLVALLCETDFVALNPEFKELAHNIALQIAAANPLYVKKEDVPSQIIQEKKEFYADELKGDKKPQNIKDKIIEGKINKYLEEVVLMDQIFIKDQTKKVRDILEQASAKFGEKIEIGKFIRYEI